MRTLSNKLKQKLHKGAMVVEFALLLPLFVFLLFGMLVMGMYVADQYLLDSVVARETRYASVIYTGDDDTKRKANTKQYIFNILDECQARFALYEFTDAESYYDSIKVTDTAYVASSGTMKDVNYYGAKFPKEGTTRIDMNYSDNGQMTLGSVAVVERKITATAVRKKGGLFDNFFIQTICPETISASSKMVASSIVASTRDDSSPTTVNTDVKNNGAPPVGTYTLNGTTYRIKANDDGTYSEQKKSGNNWETVRTWKAGYGAYYYAYDSSGNYYVGYYSDENNKTLDTWTVEQAPTGLPSGVTGYTKVNDLEYYNTSTTGRDDYVAGYYYWYGDPETGGGWQWGTKAVYKVSPGNADSGYRGTSAYKGQSNTYKSGYYQYTTTTSSSGGGPGGGPGGGQTTTTTHTGYWVWNSYILDFVWTTSETSTTSGGSGGNPPGGR